MLCVVCVSQYSPTHDFMTHENAALKWFVCTAVGGRMERLGWEGRRGGGGEGRAGLAVTTPTCTRDNNVSLVFHSRRNVTENQ